MFFWNFKMYEALMVSLANLITYLLEDCLGIKLHLQNKEIEEFQK